MMMLLQSIYVIIQEPQAAVAHRVTVGEEGERAKPKKQIERNMILLCVHNVIANQSLK